MNTLFVSLLVQVAAADNPCVSGLQPGQRPGPYAALVSTGTNRGKLHCFICETAERPAVIVFARKSSDALGKLAQGIDKALGTHKDSELRGWLTFLADDATVLDPEVVKWGKKHGVGTLPMAIFEDVDGPPSYKITKEAEVVVLLSVKQKVVHNFAFRPGELTPSKVEEVLKAVPSIVKK